MLKFLIRIPLYWQIIIAIILGFIFGAIFQVDKYALNIKYLSDKSERFAKIEKWDKIKIFQEKPENIIKVFGKEDQLQLIKFIKEKTKDKYGLIITKDNSDNVFYNVSSVEKVSTIALDIKFLGNIFVRLLSFLAIPLVISSLIVGAGSLGEVKTLGKLGLVTFLFYIFTTAFSITIGLIYVNLIKPGEKLLSSSKEQLLQSYLSETSAKINVQNIGFDFRGFLENIIPRNPFNAIANGEMLQIVFFAVMVGIVLNFVDKKYSDTLMNFFNAFSQVMIKMVTIIMKFAPIGVFALIAGIIAEFGGGIIYTLFWYIFTVIIGIITLLLTIYPFLVKFIGGMNPLHFYKGMGNAIAIAFSTSSSAATLPVNFDCVENKLGVPNKIAGFVLPLGATINMDGTALYQGVAAVFIAQVYGIELDLTMQLTILLTAVLASIGTAPVPGVGIIMLVMILNSVNVPVEGIALIIGVDRILDMCRTIPNITGDAAISVSVWNIFKNKI